MNRDQETTVASGALPWRIGSRAHAHRGILTIIAVAAGIGILASSSWLSVPFYPVPLTMQTLAVLLVGGLLGPRLGPATVLGYLALGFAGAPVFHSGLGGPAVLLGPTGGYLLGFVPAAFVMGVAARRAGRTTSRRSAGDVPLQVPAASIGAVVKATVLLAVGGLLAEVAIYACGVPWLAAVYTGGDFGQAIAVGAVPYVLGDLLKVAVAVGALRLGSAVIRERRPFFL